MTGESATPLRDDAPPPAASAGARLREAREAAGLSIDAVAQQLKLAPRQVKALEEDDFAQLPGRTFIRGFMRNYARLVRLDPDAVLATLPEGGAAPSLDHPALAPTTRVIGELPADASAKPRGARWAIPLALAAIVVIGVVYEFARPPAEHGKAPAGKTATAPAVPAAPVPAPAPAAVDAHPPAAPDETSAAAAASASPATEVVVPAAVGGDAPLALAFRGTSWVEVKDGKGTIVLSTIGYPGATHAVGGALPLEVVLGNAEAVTVTWRGAPFDAAPFTRQNVAKFTVK